MSQRQRAVEPPEGALRVGHHRQVAIPAGQPAGRAQFGQRLGPFAGPVGDDPADLANDAHPGSEFARRVRVGIGAFGIALELRRDQAPGHTVSQVGWQGLQLGAGVRFQLGSGHVVRDGRAPAAAGSAALRALGVVVALALGVARALRAPACTRAL